MHQKHEEMEPDGAFETGTLEHLVPGNEGRVLDGRRTPGRIESFDPDSAMFIWRITGFEDAGQCWEIPAEQICSYQFRAGSDRLSREESIRIGQRCEVLNRPLEIRVMDAAREMAEWETWAGSWLAEKGEFRGVLDFAGKTGEPVLCRDLEKYMKELGLLELERRTAEQYLLNPYSGEWMKGMRIVLAQMGLVEYHGPGTRKADSFSGIGTTELRRKYIVARLGFVRAVFRRAGVEEVPLFRGMSSEGEFFAAPKTLLSATFSAETALSFGDIRQDSPARSAYVVKFTCPVDRLFMTFFETKEFSGRYKEQEAVVMYSGGICF